MTPGGKDIGKGDRYVDCVSLFRGYAGRCGTRTVHRSRPSRHWLQRQDSVTGDVETYEAHAASCGASRSLLEEQSEGDLEVPESTATEEHRRVCGCRLLFPERLRSGPRLEFRIITGDCQSSLDPARRACEHCPRVSLRFYAFTKGSAHSLHSQAILKGFG